MKPKSLLIAVATACSSLLVCAESALAVPTGEKTPVNLGGASPAAHSAGSTGGSLVRTFVGLAIVIGVIWGLYWVLKQVKSSREEKASGSGLLPVATLPLGASRSLQLVRAGRDYVLVGVSEHGVNPVRNYSEEEAEAAGLLDLQVEEDTGQQAAGRGPVKVVLNELRKRTVRR
jgi:flagellar protein FliO/FliZ